MKKVKKVPLRKCVATQEQLAKHEMFRIVKTPEKTVVVDLTSRLNGRGAYLKKSKAAIDMAFKKNALAKALDIEIPESIYEQLYALVGDE